jgi:squalene synthase HpnC
LPRRLSLGWYDRGAMAGVSVEEAFAYCEARTKAHYENFPVGLFVPRRRRPYVYALYAFARAADDFADEPIYEGMRREKLADWERLLDAAYRGEAEGPIFVALGETVRRFSIPKSLLLDLLSAFRQDTEKTRYASWEELLDYCRRSANPVGRLVLLVFEQPGDDLPPLSDAICTGLQLANHWQDAALDYRRGRVYVPEDLMRRHGVSDWDFGTRRVSDGWRGMMAELIARTRELFSQGRPLCDRVSRELRFELRLTWLGGSSILDRIEATGGDVFARRPRHNALDKVALAWRAWRWPAA